MKIADNHGVDRRTRVDRHRPRKDMMDTPLRPKSALKSAIPESEFPIPNPKSEIRNWPAYCACRASFRVAGSSPAGSASRS